MGNMSFSARTITPKRICWETKAEEFVGLLICIVTIQLWPLENPSTGLIARLTVPLSKFCLSTIRGLQFFHKE